MEIETALSRQNITAYVGYEVLGHFDLLLRVWLPTSVQPDDLDQALYNELLGADYLASDFFEARNVAWHGMTKVQYAILPVCQ